MENSIKIYAMQGLLILGFASLQASAPGPSEISGQSSVMSSFSALSSSSSSTSMARPFVSDKQTQTDDLLMRVCLLMRKEEHKSYAKDVIAGGVCLDSRQEGGDFDGYTIPQILKVRLKVSQNSAHEKQHLLTRDFNDAYEEEKAFRDHVKQLADDRIKVVRVIE